MPPGFAEEMDFCGFLRAMLLMRGWNHGLFPFVGHDVDEYPQRHHDNAGRHHST